MTAHPLRRRRRGKAGGKRVRLLADVARTKANAGTGIGTEAVALPALPPALASRLDFLSTRYRYA